MQVFVTRQPIFDGDQNLQAYELLFRSGLDTVCNMKDGDLATSLVISDSFFSTGIQSITGGNRAFINFTRNLLLGGLAELLPRDQLVVEILEDVEPDEEVLTAVDRLKEMGYTIAVDDFVGNPTQVPFIEKADILKVDFMETTPEQRRDIASRFQRPGLQLLAEKVEQQDEFEAAREMGYDLFQGYFFCKPIRVMKSRIPESKMSKLRLLQVVNEPVIDLEKTEAIFRTDVSLSYKLLKYINSAQFGMRKEVSNIKQALVILGQRNLRRWGALMSYSCLMDEKAGELLVTTVCRARFCELLAEPLGITGKSEDLFMVGMFSTLDALLDMPMNQVLESIPIAPAIKLALTRGKGVYSHALELVKVLEQGDWDRLAEMTAIMNFDENLIPELYTQSVEMARSIFQLSSSEKSTAS